MKILEFDHMQEEYIYIYKTTKTSLRELLSNTSLNQKSI
jgi:hypothetical protein